MKQNLLFIVSVLVYCSASAQNSISIEQLRAKSKVKNPVSFESPKTVDPGLEPIDSSAFYKLFRDSKLLGRWEKRCCFYYAFIQEQVANKTLNLLVIEREGHYRPYITLAVLDENLTLIDEMVLADHFVDAGEALIISSTIKHNTVEQLTLDHNIGYEPFFKEIKSRFLITDSGKIELVGKNEEMRRIK